jgi:hypothetical protein
LIEERQKQLARLPKPPPEPEPAPAELPPHEVAAKPAPKAETNASKVAAQSFKPPPRKRLTKKGTGAKIPRSISRVEWWAQLRGSRRPSTGAQGRISRLRCQARGYGGWGGALKRRLFCKLSLKGPCRI